jgi:Periplasmic binding protein
MEEVRMRRVAVFLVASALVTAVAVVGGAAGTAGTAGAASSAPDQGVTATTIRVGIPYIDFSAIRKFGITLDQGNFADAYNAIIADLNAHGGVDGRKLVPYLLAVSPVGTAPAATACTQLAADDKVFVAIAPFEPSCFLQVGVPTIAGSYQSGPASGTAPNFTLTPPQVSYDPVQLKVFVHAGVFKGKKVGIFAGQTTDQPELHAVESTLHSLHVPVVDTAVDSGAPGDQAAINQQANIIAQRFQSSGVNEVVAVGEGSLVWPDALQANQSTYHPPFVATNEGTIETAVLAASISPTYLRGVLTSSPVPSNYQIWHTPFVQHCAQVVRKAYPSDKMTPPANPIKGSDQTFYSVEAACINMALFTTIAKAAGKHLTIASFDKAGYALRDVTIPGAASAVSFGPGRAYPLGPVIVVTYDPAKNVLNFDNKAATG